MSLLDHGGIGYALGKMSNTKRAVNWYFFLWIAPFAVVLTAAFLIGVGLIYVPNTGQAVWLVFLLASGWYVLLLIPALNKQDAFVRWHGRQALLIGAALTAILLLQTVDASCLFAILYLAVWWGGTVYSQLEARRGRCWLMRRFGEPEPDLQQPATPEQHAALIETIRYSDNAEERALALRGLQSAGLTEDL